MEIWYVYIIQSQEGLIYTGISKNPDKRLKQHNAGQSKWTKRGRHWKIIYQESFPSRQQARNRERYFKNTAGKEWSRHRGII
ncbi:MAG: GIY-YIG nuclease family protein [Fidelibacterota bacterium]